MNTVDFWKGDFGADYTARNRVDWRKRIPFWRDVIELTGARSAHEFGCNAGWNLSAIRRAFPDVEVAGVEINKTARHQAEAAGINVWNEIEPWVFNSFDLSFSSGVLIHIAPEDLKATMRKIVDVSAQYVLAVEYAADKEEEVEYRGHSGKLWRRPFGKMYQDMGLTLVKEWLASDGFDNCTAWLLSK
jgi:pseudaminic acid biosynthesis-associated methylase